MVEKLTDEEKEYYILVKKAFATLAPFYDIVVAPFSGVREKVVDFTNAQKALRYWMLQQGQENKLSPLLKEVTRLSELISLNLCLM